MDSLQHIRRVKYFYCVCGTQSRFSKLILTDFVSLACGGHLTATSRVKHFYSHAKFGGFDYDNNADCDWAIEAEPGRNVQLTFLTFDVRVFSFLGRNNRRFRFD